MFSFYLCNTQVLQCCAEANLQRIIIMKIRNADEIAVALIVIHAEVDQQMHIRTSCIHKSTHTSLMPLWGTIWWKTLRGFWSVIRSCRQQHILTCWYLLLMTAKHIVIYYLCISLPGQNQGRSGYYRYPIPFLLSDSCTDSSTWILYHLFPNASPIPVC